MSLGEVETICIPRCRIMVLLPSLTCQQPHQPEGLGETFSVIHGSSAMKTSKIHVVPWRWNVINLPYPNGLFSTHCITHRQKSHRENNPFKIETCSLFTFPYVKLLELESSVPKTSEFYWKVFGALSVYSYSCLKIKSYFTKSQNLNSLKLLFIKIVVPQQSYVF